MPPNFFTLLCYLTLMDGVADKSPDYILEKFDRVGQDIDYAFASLDHRNQKKVMDYCSMWRVAVPPEVQAYYDETLKAAAELAKLGFNL